MTHGIRIHNTFGDDVFADGRCLFVKDTGVCFQHSGNSEAVVGSMPYARTTGRPDAWYPLLRAHKDGNTDKLFQYTNRYFHWAGSGLEPSYNAPGATSEKIPVTAATDIADQLFFQMHPNGFVAQTQLWYALTPEIVPRKIAGVCVPEGSAAHYADPIRYFIASHSGLPAPSAGYGLRITDPTTGGVRYDSRWDNVRVRDFFVVSDTDIADVLENNAVKTYTPRQPVGDPYITTSLNWSARYDSGGDKFHYPRLSWDGSAFVLDRLQINGPSILRPGPSFYINRGFTVTVADPEI
ncbi:hypothetical protein PVW46_14445 [Mameliella sp. AT18]|uniref:hypothetical protein n=1 Tax=Mameliella sp. AT18 TaxID=3028385 RepID=UPI00084109E7|nr:hypothetical protein [Mameliella sp. AT18]MDD9731113.1 hypothetical protein [Mameliella sp. AT18]ODM46763.1 hypothetical protein A9320_24750 [Ruegeria sp. PBVC088]